VYVAEFSQAFDELAFSPGAFLVVYGLITEAPLDFPACHLGCFAFAFFARQASAGGAYHLSTNIGM
jgi:hypothetical protein